VCREKTADVPRYHYGTGTTQCKRQAVSKMRTRNFDGTHAAVVLLAASRWRWLLKFVPPARVEKSLVMGSSSSDGRQSICDTINVQCKKREVDRKYCSGVCGSVLEWSDSEP